MGNFHSTKIPQIADTKTNKSYLVALTRGKTLGLLLFLIIAHLMSIQQQTTCKLVNLKQLLSILSEIY